MEFLRRCFTRKYQKEFTSVGPNTLLINLAFLLIPIVAILYALFYVFKLTVQVILYLYYGKKFAGVVSGADTAFAIEEESCKVIVPAVMFLTYPTEVDVLEMVRKQLDKNVFKHPDDYPKLTSTHHKMFGYIYLLKSDYNVKDCVRPLEINNDASKTISTEELNDYLEKYAQDPLPKNDKVLWEIQVSKKPMQNKIQNEFVYAVMYKWHHMAADGASLISFLSKACSDEEPRQYLDDIDEKRRSGNHSTTYFKRVKHVLNRQIRSIESVLYIIYLSMGYYIFYMMIKPKDKNALHGPKLSGKKHIVWVCEDDPNAKIISTVKHIKKRTKSSFSEVLFTLISASVCDYLKEVNLVSFIQGIIDFHELDAYCDIFKKIIECIPKNFEVPESFCVAVPVLASRRKLSHKGPAIMENNISMAFMSLPSVRDSLCTSLRAIQEEIIYMRRTYHFQISYWLLNYFLEPFPMPVISRISYKEGVSLIVSILPGTEETSLFGGLKVDGGFFVTLNRWKTGVTISLFSYNNKFNIGLLIDKAIVGEKSDAKKIADNFLRNISKLDGETKKNYR